MLLLVGIAVASFRWLPRVALAAGALVWTGLARFARRDVQVG